MQKVTFGIFVQETTVKHNSRYIFFVHVLAARILVLRAYSRISTEPVPPFVIAEPPTVQMTQHALRSSLSVTSILFLTL